MDASFITIFVLFCLGEGVLTYFLITDFYKRWIKKNELNNWFPKWEGTNKNKKWFWAWSIAVCGGNLGYILGVLLNPVLEMLAAALLFIYIPYLILLGFIYVCVKNWMKEKYR